MDNSQSSDVFSENNERDISLDSPVMMMDSNTYKTLLLNTKRAMSNIVEKGETCHSTLSVIFTDILEDCATCISQSLDLTVNLLSEPEAQIDKLQEYISDAVCLIQQLSNFINNIVQAVSMSCSGMRTFPTTTGRIILTVFSHCKDSEALYGMNLKNIENHLKDLFRTCHELQLGYLMILEKHFLFDLSELEELDVLVEALEINLKIGEVVQTLDVKTMAEHWKSILTICEMYSSSLEERHIFQDCLKILCSMVENNLDTAIQIDQEEKIVSRSLKVASFTIKILLKLCNIFKYAPSKDYTHLVDLLIYVYLNSSPCLQLKRNKIPQFLSQLLSNVSVPIEALLRELISDEKFVNCLLLVHLKELEQEEKFLGYMLLITSVIKAVVQKGEEVTISKHQFIQCVFRLLPYGHTWFNIGLKLKPESNSTFQTHGLYEHLLTHTLALSYILNQEEVIFFEEMMYKGVLSCDCCSAMFCSNLWTLLARLSPQQYVTSQLHFLCKAYQKLESNKLFLKSPQEVHLGHTIGQLFQAIRNDEKIKLANVFNVDEEKHMNLWSCIKIKRLPPDMQSKAEDRILDKLNSHLNVMLHSGFRSNEYINKITYLLNTASTCSFTTSNTDELEHLLTKVWLNLCPVNNPVVENGLNKGDLWYYDYIEALSGLTVAVMGLVRKSSNLIMILHVVSKMIEKGNTEHKLVLIQLICNLLLHQINNENKQLAETIVTKIFKDLITDGDKIVRNNFLSEVMIKYNSVQNKDRISKIIKFIVSEDPSLRAVCDRLVVQRKNNYSNIRDIFKSTMRLNYRHKCLDTRIIEITSSESSINKSGSNNFDFADIDTLFEAESDSEPACKKVKLNTDLEEIISRLEKDVSLLCNVKENVTEFKSRIRDVCEKLSSLTY